MSGYNVTEVHSSMHSTAKQQRESVQDADFAQHRNTTNRQYRQQWV